jgi:hypothetical protein
MLKTEYKAGIQAHQGGELNMNEKPGMEAVMVDISNVVMSNMKYEADIIDAVMLKHGARGWHQGLPRQGVQEARDEGWDAQDQPQGQVRREQEHE